VFLPSKLDMWRRKLHKSKYVRPPEEEKLSSSRTVERLLVEASSTY